MTPMTSTALGSLRLLVLVVAAAAAVPDLQAQPAGPPPPPAPGRHIDVGGWKLHLHCTGTARPDQPTVVLEAGIGAFSVEWSLTQPFVAEHARVRSAPMKLRSAISPWSS